MPTLGKNTLTLTDAAKRMRADGRIADIAELLDQQNGIISDIPWVEGDTPGGHLSVVRTSLPTVYTRLANQGVPDSKSTADPIEEKPEIIEAWMRIDEIVARYGGDISGKMVSEAVAFAEAMNQAVADRIIYGDGLAGKIRGLALRYGKKSDPNGPNIIDAGGTGSDNMSIWLIGWGPGKIYGWYPKGSPGGLSVKNWGAMPDRNADGTNQVVYKEQWQHAIGLAVDDWRYAARIANIDVSDLAGASPPKLINRMIQALRMIPNLQACRPVFYMNRTALTWLDIQARNDVKDGGQLSYEVVDGRRVDTFSGVPIRILDRLLETEARVM